MPTRSVSWVSAYGMARTVDHISDGRLGLGLGAGFKEREYVEYGYEFDTPGSHIDDLARALPRIEHRLARLAPAPTRKIPVLIGGGGEKKMLRVVARHADIWHSFAGGEVLAHKTKVLEEHCAAVGRDPYALGRATSMRLPAQRVPIAYICSLTR